MVDTTTHSRFDYFSALQNPPKLGTGNSTLLRTIPCPLSRGIVALIFFLSLPMYILVACKPRDAKVMIWGYTVDDRAVITYRTAKTMSTRSEIIVNSHFESRSRLPGPGSKPSFH